MSFLSLEMSDDSLNEPDVYHPETMANYRDRGLTENFE